MDNLVGGKLLLPRWLEDELHAAALAGDAEREQKLSGARHQALERRRSEMEEQERRLQETEVDEASGTSEKAKPTRRQDVRLFDPRELEEFRAKLGRHHSASADRDRAKAVIKELSDLGPWRQPLRSSRAILAGLNTLRRECPNFVQVIDHIQASMVLYRGPIVLAPLLLDGPPGVGKTHLATRLAEVFGTPFRRIDVGSATASFALVGSDKAYENSQTGCLFDALSSSNSCSPVILLDELCKHPQDSQDSRHSLLPTLYALFEPLTARTFRDASIPQVALDCRYTVWLATSNSTSNIPEPLLNRMRIFKIAVPTVDEMRDVVLRVAASVWRSAGRRPPAPHLGEEVLNQLCMMPVRSAKLAIAEAFAKAILERRTQVELADLPSEGHKPRRMGFL